MVAWVATVAFQGIDTLEVDVQVHLANGGSFGGIQIVGLGDKAVAESRERVRAALSTLGLALPPKRITVNLSPADLQKEGSHYHLPIALGVLVAMGALSAEDLHGWVALGELALDGRLTAISGVLPAAIAASAKGARGVICPEACAREARWADDFEVVGTPDLMSLLNHIRGTQILSEPSSPEVEKERFYPDLADIKGQETAKRALEVAAAGRHNLLMVGPPGSGKSMLAARLPGLLPSLSPAEALEVSMIRSVAGLLENGQIDRARPFRDPHHSSSTAALIGGGLRAKPGEVSLAHRGVLFLDELAEFPRPVIDALRQPIESGRAVIARANHHVVYPARFQLVAAMNPCRCGQLTDPSQACSRAPRCAQDYQSKLSGPLLDRFDLIVEVAAVSAGDLALPPPRERTADIRPRILAAREIQADRYKELTAERPALLNAEAEGEVLDQTVEVTSEALDLLRRASETLKLTARGFHRVQRVARTLADMTQSRVVDRAHIAEALSFRRGTAAMGTN